MYLQPGDKVAIYETIWVERRDAFGHSSTIPVGKKRSGFAILIENLQARGSIQQLWKAKHGETGEFIEIWVSISDKILLD